MGTTALGYCQECFRRLFCSWLYKFKFVYFYLILFYFSVAINAVLFRVLLWIKNVLTLTTKPSTSTNYLVLVVKKARYNCIFSCITLKMLISKITYIKYICLADLDRWCHRRSRCPRPCDVRSVSPACPPPQWSRTPPSPAQSPAGTCGTDRIPSGKPGTASSSHWTQTPAGTGCESDQTNNR